MNSILSVRNLFFSYKKDIIFENVSFDIMPNTINCITGPNKCGKTTLIKLLCGIYKTKDCIIFDKDVLNKKNFNNYIKNIGVIFNQSNNKFLFDDVCHELIFPLENLNMSKTDIKIRVNEVVDMFDLNLILDKQNNELSEFDKVKILLSSVIIYSPKILFLDSIFDNLKYDEFIYFINILKKLKLTVLFTTNNLLFSNESDKLIIISDSNILYDDNPEKVYEHDNVLSKLGLSIPTMIDLSLKLKFYDLLDQIIISPERLVDELWK